MSDSHPATYTTSFGWPTVAVVIPAKNEEANISACLAAIAAQDYPTGLIKVVVVDNGSTDNTRGLAAQAGVGVLLDETATIAGLRNRGAAFHHGDVLAFIDADMIPTRKWLQTAVSVLQEAGVGAVGGMLDIPAEVGWVGRAWCVNRQTKPEKAEFGWLPSGNLLINRSAFQAIGGFNDRLATCEDVDICARLRNAGYKLMFVRKAAVIHTGESNSVRAMFQKELWRGKNSIGRLPAIRKNPREIPSILLPAVQLVLLLLPLMLAATGRFTLAATALALSLGLPVLRAVLISMKLRTISYFMPLVGVWYIYYFARAAAIIVR